MGNFYKNLTLVGPDRPAIATALQRLARTAYVTPTQDATTVVFDRRADAAADPAELGDLAITLSQELACVTLAAAVYDDDVLLLGAYTNGDQAGEYNSSGGGSLTAASLRRLLAVPAARGVRLRLVMAAPHMPLFVFETWRHALILKMLGMPPWAAGTGYKYVHQGEPPPDLDPDDLIHVGENL